MDRDFGRKSVVYGNSRRAQNDDINRAIRKIMGVVERHTNYEEIDPDKRDIVRDTVLTQINRLARVTRNKQTMLFGENS